MFKRLKIKPKQSYKTIDGTSGKGVLRDECKKAFEFYLNVISGKINCGLKKPIHFRVKRLSHFCRV